jgi:hypothetical protein
VWILVWPSWLYLFCNHNGFVIDSTGQWQQLQAWSDQARTCKVEYSVPQPSGCQVWCQEEQAGLKLPRVDEVVLWMGVGIACSFLDLFEVCDGRCAHYDCYSLCSRIHLCTRHASQIFPVIIGFWYLSIWSPKFYWEAYCFLYVMQILKYSDVYMVKDVERTNSTRTHLIN